MWEAYERVKANKGAAGVDRQSIEEFESDLRNNLYKIWNRMSSGTYFPPAVMAVEIPKAGAGTRMLGVPTVADRVAQTVAAMTLEPRTEAIFHRDSYGYRPGWLCSDAHTSPQRILCHTYGRGKDQHIMIPGWPYSVICALEPGRHSWTAPLDAQRLAPGDDAAMVIATQLRQLVTVLIDAGQWQPSDPHILIVADAGYDAPRLAFLLSDLLVVVLGWMRCDRVLRRAAPPRTPGYQRLATSSWGRVRLR